MPVPPFTHRITVDGDGHPVIAHLAGADPGAAPVVVASHGITSNAASFARLAEELGTRVTFVALDHRGRGDSSDHPGPYGLAAHGRDCVAVFDHLGVDRGVLAGHSMGAYVVARAATDFPYRVAAIVLIDGGLPIEVPDGIDPSEAVDAVVGPAVARLSLTWPDRDAVHEMWQAHPAFREWMLWHERYVGHDVTETADGSLSCRVNEAAVRFDGAETIVDPDSSRLVLDLEQSTWLLRAPRGLLDDPDSPLLRPGVVAALRAERPDVEIIEMAADINHYNIVWGDSGAPIVADAIRAAVAPP
jgi:pimeloyl-ACP methyl ester carboxylesterase